MKLVLKSGTKNRRDVNYELKMGFDDFDSSTYGVYYFTIKHKKLPRKVIYINSKTSIACRTYTLLHEIGHSKCHSKKCRCFNGDILSEVHAESYAIRQCIDNNYDSALLRGVTEIMHSAVEDERYDRIFNNLRNKKVWKDAIKKLNTIYPKWYDNNLCIS